MAGRPRGSVSASALISWPPSRALRMVVPDARYMTLREAIPGGPGVDPRTSTVSAPGRRNAVAAFGPAPAAPMPSLRLTAGVSSSGPAGRHRNASRGARPWNPVDDHAAYRGAVQAHPAE